MEMHLSINMSKMRFFLWEIEDLMSLQIKISCQQTVSIYTQMNVNNVLSYSLIV